MPRKLLFEMPFAVDAPQLANAVVGIDRVTTRGKGHSFAVDLTLLDTPDHRLMRAGVLLSYQVRDGLGQWRLAAPQWQPWLPADEVEAIGAAGDLPPRFAELLRPIRRRATLGAAVAVHQTRVEYQLKSRADEVLGTLRDDSVRVSRGGLTTSRHREVTVMATAAMSREQRTFLSEVLLASGGIRVEAFDDTLRRLAAPQTGLTDFPVPRPWDKDVSIEAFVSWLLATRLQVLVRTDLDLREREWRSTHDQSDEPARSRDAAPPAMSGTGPLLDELSVLRRTVGSLAFVLEPTWRERFEREVQVVLDRPSAQPVSQLDEHYFGVIDQLVLAVRAPQLGDAHGEARTLLRRQAHTGIELMAERCHKVRVDSPDEAWAAALLAAQRMSGLVEATGVLFGRRAKRLGKLLRRVTTGLAAGQTTASPPTDDEIRALEPIEAFAVGQAHQRSLTSRDLARAGFVADWPAVRERLLKLRAS